MTHTRAHVIIYVHGAARAPRAVRESDVARTRAHRIMAGARHACVACIAVHDIIIIRITKFSMLEIKSLFVIIMDPTVTKFTVDLRFY